MNRLIELLPWWIRYPIAVIGFIIGTYMTVEAWVIEKAQWCDEVFKFLSELCKKIESRLKGLRMNKILLIFSILLASDFSFAVCTSPIARTNFNYLEKLTSARLNSEFNTVYSQVNDLLANFGNL